MHDYVYRRHVLDVRIVRSVSAKESAREYPLDRLNDMRALINYAPTFARECGVVGDDLVEIARDPARLTTSRLLRINCAVLLGIGVNAKLGVTSSGSSMGLLNELDGELWRRLKRWPEVEDMSLSSDVGIDNIPQDATERRLATYVAWKASELADRAGFGEQNLYAHAPVMRGKAEKSIYRAFYYPRKPAGFAHQIVTVTRLRHGAVHRMDVPLFRGKALVPVAPGDREAVRIVRNGRPVTTMSELTALNEEISQALRASCSREESIALKVDLDVRKVIIYSAELRAIARANGLLWALDGESDATIRRRLITGRLGLDEESGYARAMFELIRTGLEHASRGSL
jgi:hypothetical protein